MVMSRLFLLALSSGPCYKLHACLFWLRLACVVVHEAGFISLSELVPQSGVWHGANSWQTMSCQVLFRGFAGKSGDWVPCPPHECRDEATVNLNGLGLSAAGTGTVALEFHIGSLPAGL